MCGVLRPWEAMGGAGVGGSRCLGPDLGPRTRTGVVLRWRQCIAFTGLKFSDENFEGFDWSFGYSGHKVE